MGLVRILGVGGREDTREVHLVRAGHAASGHLLCDEKENPHIHTHIHKEREREQNEDLAMEAEIESGERSAQHECEVSTSVYDSSDGVMAANV